LLTQLRRDSQTAHLPWRMISRKEKVN